MFVTYSFQLKTFSHDLSLIKTSTVQNLLFIANYLSYKPQSDLSSYKRNELESTFVKLFSPMKAKVVVVDSNCRPVLMDLLNLSIVFYSRFKSMSVRNINLFFYLVILKLIF